MTKVEILIRSLEKRGLLRASAKRVVVSAITAGALREVRTAAVFEDTRIVGEVPHSVLLDEIYRCLPEGIVATAPVAVPDTRPTLEVFRLIIATAATELLVASPYIDAGGVEHLAGSLVAAGERGVQVYLLTRETGRHQPTRTAGMGRLAELVGRGLEVRDYHALVNGHHAAAVHAKLLVAGETIGYVGSAEMRQHALLSNFEMGYFFHRGASAMAARQAFMAFWQIAWPVDVLHL